jgi:hypothetical protein
MELEFPFNVLADYLVALETRKQWQVFQREETMSASFTFEQLAGILTGLKPQCTSR